MPGKDWVDFKAVKATVTIEAVLKHYGLLEKFERKGDRLTGPCPIHKGTRKSQFSADLKKGAFKCFSGGCCAHGNAIDLVAGIEGLEFREAAKLLQEWFGIRPEKPADEPGKDQPKGRSATKPPAKPVASAAAAEPPEQPAKREATDDKAPNKPLTFQLKLDPAHPYLAERGLTAETVAHFGLGYSDRGSMKGRLAVPLHNLAGEIVGYAGRWAGKDSEIPDGEGKWKLPAGFKKGLEAFNAHRVSENTKVVTLVEGCWSVFWLHQNGYQNVVSVLGSAVSKEQAEILATRYRGVQILFDGDPAGREGARKAALELAPRMWVRVLDLADGRQPDTLLPHELKRLLGS